MFLLRNKKKIFELSFKFHIIWCSDVSYLSGIFSVFVSLGPLVNKVKEFQVETIVDTLCSNMLSDKEQLRDISSIGRW